MKRTFLSIIILLIISSSIDAQHLGRHKSMIKKYCDGVYLMHQVIKKDSSEIKLVLTEKNIYGFYLFNLELENRKMPELKVINPDNNHIERFQAYYNDKQQYRYIKYKASKTGIYTIKVKLDNINTGHAVLALTFLGELNKKGKQDTETN